MVLLGIFLLLLFGPGTQSWLMLRRRLPKRTTLDTTPTTTTATLWRRWWHQPPLIPRLLPEQVPVVVPTVVDHVLTREQNQRCYGDNARLVLGCIFVAVLVTRTAGRKNVHDIRGQRHGGAAVGCGMREGRSCAGRRRLGTGGGGQAQHGAGPRAGGDRRSRRRILGALGGGGRGGEAQTRFFTPCGTRRRCGHCLRDPSNSRRFVRVFEELRVQSCLRASSLGGRLKRRRSRRSSSGSSSGCGGCSNDRFRFHQRRSGASRSHSRRRRRDIGC